MLDVLPGREVVGVGPRAPHSPPVEQPQKRRTVTKKPANQQTPNDFAPEQRLLLVVRWLLCNVHH